MCNTQVAILSEAFMAQQAEVLITQVPIVSCFFFVCVNPNVLFYTILKNWKEEYGTYSLPSPLFADYIVDIHIP